MAKAKRVFIMFAAGLVLAAAVWAEPDVYMAGFEETANDKIACYWKNGVKTVLPGGRTGGNIYAQANAVTVSGGGDVYVAGWVNKQGDASLSCYWKNGVMVPLTGGKTHVDITGIAVSGNDVYVSGSESGVACYWKNGTKTALTNGRAYDSAKGIAVSGPDVYVAGLERNAAGNAACYWKTALKLN